MGPLCRESVVAMTRKSRHIGHIRPLVAGLLAGILVLSGGLPLVAASPSTEQTGTPVVAVSDPPVTESADPVVVVSVVASPDTYEPDARDIPAWMLPGMTVDRYLDSDDVDWFSFELQAGAAYVIQGGVRENQFLDARADLFVGVSTSPVASDDDSGPWMMPEITYTATANGVAFVRVSGLSSAETGGYTLSVRQVLPATIHGIVTDASGVPLESAVVRLFATAGDYAEQAQALTDAGGAYMFSDVAPGSYRVGAADSDGEYVPCYATDADSVYEADDVYAASGESVQVGTLVLRRWATLGGFVNDWTGSQPLGEIRVTVYSASGDDWLREVVTATDNNGLWSTMLPEGTYRVGYVDPQGESFARFYPESDNIEAAESIELNAPGRAVVTHLEQQSQFSGVVVRSDNGEPVEGIVVTLVAVSPDGLVEESTSAQNGYFEIQAPTGEYVAGVTSTRPDYVLSSPAIEGQDVVLSPEGVEREYEVDAAGFISGTVRDIVDGTAIAGARISVLRSVAGEYVQIGRAAVTDEDGAYAVTQILPGTYTVAAETPGSEPVAWYLGNTRNPDSATPLYVEALVGRSEVDLSITDDVTPPVTVLEEVSSLSRAPIEVELTAHDDGSGVAATFARTDSGSWIAASSIRLERAGAFEVQYYSVDFAGNAEEPKSTTVSVRDHDAFGGPVEGGGTTAEASEVTKHATAVAAATPAVSDVAQSASVVAPAGVGALQTVMQSSAAAEPWLGSTPEKGFSWYVDWSSLLWPSDSSVTLLSTLVGLFGAALAIKVHVPQAVTVFAASHGPVLRLPV